MDAIESRRHGATGSRRWTCEDGRAKDRGIVWRRGGVDGKNDEDYAEIYPEGCSMVLMAVTISIACA
jgi:hypothetical protein